MIDKLILINHSKVIQLFQDSIMYGKGYFKSQIDNNNNCPIITNSNTPFNDDLIQMHLNGTISAKEAIEAMNLELFSLFKDECDIDWSKVFYLLGRNNVFPLFKNMIDHLSDEDYWMILGYCYTSSDFAFQESQFIREFLQADRPKREFLMNEEEREFLKNLPDEITIYRGCSTAEIESEEYRFSWTLDKKIAEFFAYEYRRNVDIESSVVCKTIQKSNALAYFNDKSEEEIVFLSRSKFDSFKLLLLNP